VGLLLGGAGAVSAGHDHNLTTPGKVVVDIANGQTEKCADEPAGHKFHENVHLGTPGTTAFENPNNPVSVAKEGDDPCNL
ncbi:MAG: hypothetical protein AB7V46_21730, partial [Thermomicrobiales bacterium]